MIGRIGPVRSAGSNRRGKAWLFMLVLTFRVNQILYAIPVHQVVEVVPRVALRPVPHAPDCVLGLLRYRGAAVPIIDLGLLLGRSPSADRLDTRILLVHAANDRGLERLGLLAEEVNDLVEVDAGRMAMRSSLMLSAPYLGQVYETETGLLQLIDPDRIKVSEVVEAQGAIES